MKCKRIPAQLWAVYADNGDPLLLYGYDDEGVMLWPTWHIQKHPIAFGRFCKQHVHEMRGKRFTLHHKLCWRTKRWADWLGVRFESGTVEI